MRFCFAFQPFLYLLPQLLTQVVTTMPDKLTDPPIGSPTKEQLANLGSFAGMDPEGYFVIKFPGKIDLDFNLVIDLAHNLPLDFSSQVVI